MNKLSKTQRQRNYFNSIDKIKRELIKRSSPKSHPRTKKQQEADKARRAAQKAYNEQQSIIATAKWEAEEIQLIEECKKLFSGQCKSNEEDNT